MHPLDSAYTRISRAEEHIQHLERLADELGMAEALAALRMFQDRAAIPFGGSLEALRFLRYPQTPVPLPFSLLIGEVLYHLRTALDYLVFELAVHDSGSEQARTQFPIFDQESHFSGSGRRMLVGVNSVHRARIEELQPYKGPHNAWLALLRDLSNRDKHREVRPVILMREIYNGPRDAPTDAPEGASHVEVNINFNPSIAFAPTRYPFQLTEGWEPTWVVPALRDIATHVRAVLDLFNADF